MTPLQAANAALREQRHEDAIRGYLRILLTTPTLGQFIHTNLQLARRRYRAARRQAERPRVQVCGCDLAQNAAGRAHTLAQLYEPLAEVSILGAIFPHPNRTGLWPPLGASRIPIRAFPADGGDFPAQAVLHVLDQPADLVHLSKPRMPNILFGILYKLVWGARILVDIDDEDLAFVNAETPLHLEDYLHRHVRLPPLDELTKGDWTRLGVGLAPAFDGITVSNPALQQRYGGVIIRHARDERHFTPSAERRRHSRERLGIGPEQKVVVFLGTPRRHKGLLEAAQALVRLRLPEVVFLIIGSFPAAEQKLKRTIKAIAGLDVRFMEDQPFADIPDLLACGDICLLLQDTASPIARFQVPAKLTDALAMGLQVLAEPTPALADLAVRGAFTPVNRDSLDQALAAALVGVPYPPRPHPLFQELLSLTANQPQMQALLRQPAPDNTELSTALQRWCLPRLFALPLGDLLYSLPGHLRGLSVIILTRDAAPLLNRLLTTFLASNTYQPFELIVIDHGTSDDGTSAVIARHQAQAEIWHIHRHQNFSFAASGNFAASLARYPHLLFLNNDIVCTSDVLPAAMQRLSAPGIGAVGVRLDDDSSRLATGREPGVQHTGIHFVWNERRGYHQPEQIRHPSLAAYLAQHQARNPPDGAPIAERHPAVTGAFLLCRKSDFQAVGGFCPDYDYGLEDIDFCLRLSRDLNKINCCLTGVSLQHAEGATRKRLIGRSTIDRNHQRFKVRWNVWIDAHHNQPWGQALPLPEQASVRLARPGRPSSILPVLSNRHKPSTPASSSPRVAVAVHVFYPEIWPEIATRLRSLDHPFDLFITTTDTLDPAAIAQVRRDFPQARISINPNQGMDILPFLKLIPALVQQGYPAVCKLHTKKGDSELAAIWRQVMLDTLIGDTASFTAVAHAFHSQTDLVLAGPASLYQSATRLMLDNRPALDALLDQLGIHEPATTDWGFFAGTAFWVRPSLLEPLAARLVRDPAALLDNHSQRDGQGVHALERIFGLLPGLSQQRTGLLHPAAPPAAGFRLQIANSAALAAAIGQASMGDLMRQYAHLSDDRQALTTRTGFDADHYLLQNPDLAGLDIDLASHFLLIGRFQGQTAHGASGTGEGAHREQTPARASWLAWSWFRRGNQGNRRFPLTPTLVPRNQVAATDPAPSAWRSQGEDPQFELEFPHDNFPRPGWYRIDLLLATSSPRQTAKFYLDTGNGYSEDQVVDLPYRNRRPAKRLIHLDAGTTAIRFDPMDREGPFQVFVLRLLPLTEAAALDSMLTLAASIAAKSTTVAKLRQSLKRRARRKGTSLISEVKRTYDQGFDQNAESISYQEWIDCVEAPSLPAAEVVKDRLAQCPNPPLISVVVPVYNTPVRHLRACLDSVLAQSYPHWELCIADDASPSPRVRQVLEDYCHRDQRIRVVYRQENGHISRASNSALEIAKGDYVAFLDHDDALARHALYFVALEIIANPQAQVIYSDEDKLTEDGQRVTPHFKSDWNPDLFYSQNYVCHLTAYRRHLLSKIGGFRIGVEGSQDHDLLLRCLPHLTEGQIQHIPRILYHWRIIDGSTAKAASEKGYTKEAGLKALRDYFSQQGPAGIQVEPGIIPNTYRVRWPIPQPAPPG